MREPDTGAPTTTGERGIVEGQSHIAVPTAFAAVLEGFFTR
jgi:hypothetical protein